MVVKDFELTLALPQLYVYGSQVWRLHVVCVFSNIENCVGRKVLV